MKISVVMTAMNNQDTIMEATESILSQRRLADQFGVILGPSRDRTDEFINFYREELDFVQACENPDPYRCGRARLRLQAVTALDGDFVLFVPADVFLYPEALARYESMANSASVMPECVLGTVKYVTDDMSEITWGPGGLGARNILNLGPVNAAGVLWNVERLRAIQSRLSSLECGPFSNLAWILSVLDTERAQTELLDQPVAEAWNRRQGPVCWDRSVCEGLVSLVYHAGEIIPDSVSQILSWAPDQGRWSATEEWQKLVQQKGGEPSGGPDTNWVDASIPFSE